MLDEAGSRSVFNQALDLLKQGQVEEAERICRDAIEEDGSDANFLGLLGAILLKRDQPGQAIRYLEKAVEIAPGFAQAHEDLGSAYFYTDRVEAAISHLEKALQLDRRLESAANKLGYVLRNAGRQSEADELYKAMFSFSPEKRRLVEALELFRQRKHREAEKIAREVVRNNPKNVDGLRLLALLAAEAACHEDAEKLLRRVVELAPLHIDAWHELSAALKEQEKLSQAVQVLEEAIEIKPDNAQSHYLLGSALALSALPYEAVAPYRRSLELRPNYSPALLGLGHVLKTIGNFEAGVKAYQDAIKLRPGFAEAYWSLANLKTFRFSDEDIANMKTELEKIEGDTEDKAHFYFSLAKACEDRRDFDQAFAYYSLGNQVNRMLIAYDPVQTEVVHEQIREVFSRDFLEQKGKPGNPDPAPIFILGLPRSGSTLVEQILASHSMVDGTSELQDLGRLATSLNKRSGGVKYPHIVRLLSDDDLYQLGRNYIDSTLRHRRGAPFFTDKMPNNFPSIGFLSLILPNAKIINTMKNPLDSCLGCFKQHFARGQAFTYDLNELGEFYLEYTKMMAHWHEVLPGRVLDVHYEDMVADQETQTRRLLEYCGLPFEETCLRFYETERAIRTASSEQVREPIHGNAVDYWKNFEKHLQPLIEVLQPVLGQSSRQGQGSGQ